MDLLDHAAALGRLHCWIAHGDGELFSFVSISGRQFWVDLLMGTDFRAGHNGVFFDFGL